MHAAALWVWHAPSIFQAALATPALHELQHLSFVVSALLFWSGLLVAGGAAGRGGASLYLFTTTVHTSVLGALITFARTPWYTPAIRLEQSLDSMTDQQLGGLIMWVPGSLVYVGFGVLLLMRWVLDSGLSTHSVRPDRP